MAHPIFDRIDEALKDVEPSAITAKTSPEEHEAIAWADGSEVIGHRVLYKGVYINRVRADGWTVDWEAPAEQPRGPDGRWVKVED